MNYNEEYSVDELDAITVAKELRDDEPAVDQYTEPAVDSSTVEPELELEPVKAKAKKTSVSSLPPSPAGSAVSSSGVDEVHVSKLVYKSRETKKSLSVHHLQRRLVECGYTLRDEKDGWLADLTVEVLTAFQADNGLEPTGKADLATVTKLFADDPNVVVIK